MRTRIARWLLAAARRLDPAVITSSLEARRALWSIPLERAIRWGDPVPRSRDEVDKAIASMEYARQQYGLHSSGGRILGPGHRSEDTVGSFKLSEGGPVASLDAPMRGDVIRIELPGEPPAYRRVLYTRRTGENTTICGFGPLEP